MFEIPPPRLAEHVKAKQIFPFFFLFVQRIAFLITRLRRRYCLISEILTVTDIHTRCSRYSWIAHLVMVDGSVINVTRLGLDDAVGFPALVGMFVAATEFRLTGPRSLTTSFLASTVCLRLIPGKERVF